MAYTASADDWFALLGVDQVLPAVFEGRATVGTARAALVASRDRWPGTNADYVALVDRFMDALADAEAAIQSQARALAALRSNIDAIEQSVPEDFPGAFLSTPPSPVDRLMTDAESALIGQIGRELQTVRDEIDNWVNRLEDEADEAEAAADAAEEDADNEEDG